MSDDDAMYDDLHGVAWLCDKMDLKRSATTCRMAAAENARLTAEVERLTPKEMTDEEIADALSKHKAFGFGAWKVMPVYEGKPYFGNHMSSTGIRHKEARILAQGLLRDAGPIVESEERSEAR